MNRVVKVLISTLLCSLIVGVPSLWAEWVEDGVPICTASSTQCFPNIISDGEGGAIVVWPDWRNGSTYFDIYVQRINSSGAVLWTADGVPLCTAVETQYSPQLISDGAGGAIVTWSDERSGDRDIYIQRINSVGTVLWTADGVPLCTAVERQSVPELVSDGAGGAIVTWSDTRNDSDNYDIYAQRIDAAGAVQWAADGVPLCTETGWQRCPELVSDGTGGAIVTWQDGRKTKPELDYNIYAQRINASGTVEWATDGIAISLSPGFQDLPQITSDGAGGAIVTWEGGWDTNADIYVQHVNAAGTVEWTADGMPICTAADAQVSPEIVSDGTGGAIVVWGDGRDGYSIYIQRINASGAVHWTADGVPICTTGYRAELTSDGAGGAIVAWADGRDDEGDIYAQHIDNLGTLQWAPDGEPLCTATFVQRFPEITSDGAGGAIVAWEDARTGSVWDADIYVQQTTYVITGTETPETPHAAYLEQNYPNPFNPQTTIRFGLDKPGPVTLKIYDPAGRLVATIFDKAMPAGNYTETWDGKDANGGAVSSGVYFYKLDTGSKIQTRKMILLR